MHSRSVLLGLVLAITLSGCVAAQPFDEAARGELTQTLPELPDDWQSGTPDGENPLGWVAGFDDPALLQLIAEAQSNNRSIAVAAANLDRSRALVRQARSSLRPTLGLSVGATRAGSEDFDVDNVILGGQLSWEVDVWGRLRSGAMAAYHSNAAVEADYRYAQLSLAAATARTYFAAIEARLQSDIASENVQVLDETLRIVAARHHDGIGSAQDMALARSDLASAREGLVAAEGVYRETVRALEVLVGRYPGATLEVQTALPAVPASPSAGLPSQLLERRPDLVAAERRVAASFSALDQAKATRLPSISLTGDVLTGDILTGDIIESSPELADLLDPINVVWRVGANLLAPLIDGGLRKSQVDAATADQRQAIAAYGEAALDAFAEVENTLDQGTVIAARALELDEASSEADKAFRIANLRYREGESDLLDVLTLQRRVIASKSSLCSIQRQLLEQRIDLHLAIGGDW